MQSPPSGYPRVSPYLLYEDAEAAIRYLSETFGFELRHTQTGGRDDCMLNFCSERMGSSCSARQAKGFRARASSA